MFTVVLVEPESDGNIGFVSRVMKNFSIRNLVLVNPKAPLGDEIKAYSMHGYDVYRRSRKEKSLNCLKNFDLVVGFTGNVRCGSKILRDPIPLKELKTYLKPKKIALVFGRESRGLSNEELAECGIISTIPANPKYPTMNLSHAVSVVLYELTQEKYHAPNDLASRATKNHLINYLNHLTDAESFKDPGAVKLAFMRAIAKSNMTEKEAKAILTLFAKLVNHDCAKQRRWFKPKT